MLSKLAVQDFLRKGRPGLNGGVIVNIGSICGLRGGLGGVAYTISKHGLLGLTRSKVASNWKDGVRCNILMPGGMQTNIVAGNASNTTGYAMSQSVKGLLKPEAVDIGDLAKLAVYLCSDAELS